MCDSVQARASKLKNRLGSYFAAGPSQRRSRDFEESSGGRGHVIAQILGTGTRRCGKYLGSRLVSCSHLQRTLIGHFYHNFFKDIQYLTPTLICHFYYNFPNQ